MTKQAIKPKWKEVGRCQKSLNRMSKTAHQKMQVETEVIADPAVKEAKKTMIKVGKPAPDFTAAAFIRASL